ncbi:hypothetical protein TWF569_003047 [Orbilia oligospora]|uniref:Uncharacterized protein n=1 Tax=Orbilia oligospora TaxID=2813651 RepID=A0A7C8IZS7_ORBOL|nr:hypothetical protein TWF103_004759 [Orbilia oligospora]KAF3084702.1 hypothetical protein TWF102_011859 [Orbilia oligospora]KAF3120792.1 hypothetical protein TWF569_003047 [Orbilia oligospora]KAF3124668.1 hypothetical protein TWF594_001791 [Orbilia oligospora]
MQAFKEKEGTLPCAKAQLLRKILAMQVLELLSFRPPSRVYSVYAIGTLLSRDHTVDVADSIGTCEGFFFFLSFDLLAPSRRVSRRDNHTPIHMHCIYEMRTLQEGIAYTYWYTYMYKLKDKGKIRRQLPVPLFPQEFSKDPKDPPRFRDGVCAD